MDNKINILVCTPAYSGLVHVDYVNSILDMQTKKLPISIMFLSNESLITRGRNSCISYFHEMKQFTHLLFIDADIGINAESIMQMLSHNKDVIAAPVPLKGYDQNGNKVYNVTMPELDKETGLYKVAHVGTAVFMLSRKAVDSLIVNAIKNDDIYSGNKLTRGDNKDIKHYDVFKTGVYNGVYLSEDYYVCKVLKDLGYDVFVDDKIATVHNGMYRW